MLACGRPSNNIRGSNRGRTSLSSLSNVLNERTLPTFPPLAETAGCASVHSLQSTRVTACDHVPPFRNRDYTNRQPEPLSRQNLPMCFRPFWVSKQRRGGDAKYPISTPTHNKFARKTARVLCLPPLPSDSVSPHILTRNHSYRTSPWKNGNVQLTQRQQQTNSNVILTHARTGGLNRKQQQQQQIHTQGSSLLTESIFSSPHTPAEYEQYLIHTRTLNLYILV